MVAKDQEVLGQNDFSNNARQKIVRKVLKSREEDVKDTFDDMAATVPVVRIDDVVGVFVVAQAPWRRSLE